MGLLTGSVKNVHINLSYVSPIKNIQLVCRSHLLGRRLNNNGRDLLLICHFSALVPNQKGSSPFTSLNSRQALGDWGFGQAVT